MVKSTPHPALKAKPSPIMPISLEEFNKTRHLLESLQYCHDQMTHFEVKNYIDDICRVMRCQ